MALEDLVGHIELVGVVALAGDGNRHGAGVGDVGAVGELVVLALDERLAAVLDDGLLRLLGAVVHDVGQGAHGHAVVLGGLDALGRDGQGAVHDHEGDLGEACARVLEVAGLELHVVGAGVGAAHGRIAGELEVGLRVEWVGGLEAVALDRLLGAVVGLSCAVARDGDDDLGVISGNDELAEGAHDEVVLVKRAFVQRVGELVEALAGQRLRARDVVGRALAVDKASALDGHIRLSVLRERSTVIGLGGTCRGQVHVTHGHADLLGRSSVLALGVVGSRGTQLNGRAVAHVRCGDGSRVVHPGLAVEAVLNGQGVAVLVTSARPISRKRSAVVHLLNVAGVPRNAVSVDLATLDGERTVFDDELDIREVGVGVGELPLIETHGVGALSGALGHGLTGEGEVALLVQGVGDGRDGVAGHGLLGAVIGLGLAVALDGNGDLVGDGRHLEGALVLSDLVVASPEAHKLGVGDGVGHLAIGHVGHGAGGAHVGDLAGDEALVAGLLPAADLGQAVGLAVIGAGQGAGGQVHLALEDLVGHLGRAVVVALAGDGHGHGTCVGDVGTGLVGAVGELVVLALDERLVAVLDDGGLALGLTVVHDVGQGAHGHAVDLGGLDALGRDGKGAVHDHEGDLGEAGARVLEVAGLELHVVFAGVGAAHGRIAGELEVGLRVELVGGLEVVALDRLLGAVVDEGTAVLGDGDDDLGVISGDDELAVLGSHLVVGGVRTLVEHVGEGVVALAHCRLRAGDGDGHALAVDKADTLALRGGGDGTVGERGAVVLLVGALGGKRDEALGDGDALGAGGVLALGVVGAGRAKHDSLMAEVREVDLGVVAHPRLAVVDAVLNLESVAVLVGRGRFVGRKRISVIDFLDVLSVPVDAVDVDLAARDGELAVMDDELDVREVVADVGELIGAEAHVIRANNGTLGHSRTRELDIGLGVGGVVRVDGIAGHHLLGAVIGLGLVVARDGDGDLVGDGRHLEGAVVRGELVVAGLGVGVELVHECVLNFAHVGDGGRVRERRTLAFSKAGDGLHFMLGVLGSVVGPLAGSRDQSDLSLVDDELAVLGLHHELVGHNVAGTIGHNGSTDDVIGILTNVGLARVLGRKAGNGVCNAVDFEDIRLNTCGFMNFAVVGGNSGVRLNGDLVLSVAIPNRKNALDLVDGVVLSLRTFVQCIGEGVERFAHGSLRAGEGVRGTFALGPTSLGLERGVAVDERGSIILFVKIGRLKSDLRLGDVDIAVAYLEDDVLEVNGVAVGELVGLEAHVGLAGIGALRLGSTREDDLVLRVELIVGREDVSRSREFLTIVGTAGVVTDDGDNNRGHHGVDHEGALVGRDGVVVGIGALIQRVAERVEGFTGVSLRTGDAVGRTLAHDKAVAGDGDLVLDQSRAVVGLVSGGGGQRDRALRDGHGAVFNNLEGHVGEVLVDVRELLGLEPHVGLAGVGTLGTRRTLESKVDTRLSTIQVVGSDTVDSDALGDIASRNVLSAVVQLGILVTLDLDNDSLLVRGHLKGALGLGDGVVVGVGALVQRVGERVARFTSVELGTSDIEGRALALDEALTGDSDLVVGQNRAVVHLRSGGGRQGDRTRLNRKFARLGENFKLSGHVVACRISHLGGAGDVADLLANVCARGLSSQTRNGVCDVVDREFVSQTGDDVLLAVVGVGGGFSLDLNLVPRATVGDGQCAGAFLQVVVVEVRVGLRRNFLDGALTRTNLNLLATIRAALDTLALGEGAEDDLEICCDERSTVVLLVSFHRLDTHVALGNRQLAVDSGHLELGGNVVTGCILDNRRARDEVVVLTSVGTLGIRGRETLDRVFKTIGNDRRGLETLGRMNTAVIGGGSRVRFNRDLILLCAVGDLKLTVALGDGVVLSLCVAVQLVGEGVGRAAHDRLRAGKGIRGTLACCPTLTGNLDRSGAVNKRDAVVLLGKVGRVESNSTLGNVKLAIHHVKTDIGEVLRDSVHKRKARASESHVVGTNIGTYRLGRHVVAQDNLILCDQLAANGLDRKALDGLHGTVIRFGVRLARNRDNNLTSIRIDEELARICVRNDVLTAFVDGTNRAVLEIGRIRACIRAARTYDNVGELDTFRRTGKTRNRVLCAVVVKLA